MRFDGHRYVNCRWCAGRGCLQCEAEFDAAYKRAFPNGPQPIATFKRDDPADMERLRNALSPEALTKFFGPNGQGTPAFEAALKGETKESSNG